MRRQLITVNSAARVRGTGRKGQRRIQEFEQTEKAWATPLEALLIAERVALLSRRWTLLVLVLLAEYTGLRWSEVMALTPKAVEDEGVIHVHWKLYEEAGRWYWGRPKDGGIRDVHVPAWLWKMLQAVAAEARKCTCKRKDGDPAEFCSGRVVLFLGEQLHYRRSDFARLYLRPAADGWYPSRGGKYGRDAKPVLVDVSASWPGTPLVP